MSLSCVARRMPRVACCALLLALGSAPVSAATFTNPGQITINAINQATPYPSTILVSGVAGTVAALTVGLADLTHSFPSDVAILLVGPQGQDLVLMSEVGGSHDIAGVDLVFDDAAAEDVLIGVQITSGSYKPTRVGSPIFPAPAPAVSAATTLAAFAGTDPNGVWSLYVVDDSAGDSGSIGAWSITLPEPGAGGPVAAFLALLAIRKTGAAQRG